MNKVHFMSSTDDWETPQWFFDKLNDEFCFNLDPCASDENHKCEKYYTIDDDGIGKNWGGTECFAIPHTGDKLVNGLEKHITKVKKTTRSWLCLFLPEQTPNGFINTFTTSLKSGLLKAG